MLPGVKQLVLATTRARWFTRLVEHWEDVDRREPHFLRILTYHRINFAEAAPQLDPMLLSATPADFALQMQFIAEQYQAVSVEQVLDCFTGGAALPSRAVWITFDDAYRDFADYAWPILQRYGLPTTLFTPTAFLDHPARMYWWDRLHHALTTTCREELIAPDFGRLRLETPRQRRRAHRALKRHVRTLPHACALDFVDEICQTLRVAACENAVLDWETLRRLQRDGVVLGGHTHSHPLLTRLDRSAVEAEILRGFARLERDAGEAAPVFAYPVGAYNDAVVAAAPRSAVRIAVTTERGVNYLPNADPLRLRRIDIGRSTHLTLFRAQLLPHGLHRWRFGAEAVECASGKEKTLIGSSS